MGIIKKKQVGSSSLSAPLSPGVASSPAGPLLTASDVSVAPEPEASWPEDSWENLPDSSPIVEDPWDMDAFLAGELPDRRQRNERRDNHRREEDLNLIATAEGQVDAIQRYAYEEGYAQALQQAEVDILELKQLFIELNYGRDEALNDLIRQIGPLAIAAAEKILKVEISCDEMLVDRLVRDTIQKAGKDNKTILIKVNPSDVATLRQSLKDEPIANLDAELTILDDKEVVAGSCVIETNSGLIDANFKTQLALLKKLIG